MIPFYKIVVNESDETGIDFNSLVDYPAHMKNYIAFGEDSKPMQFLNEEKRTITGVMISVGTPIFRRDKEIGDHYVVFDDHTTALIRRKFFKGGFVQNLNEQHDSSRIVKGATLIDSYIVSHTDSRLPNVPEAFSHMKLMDGSWIASYYIEDESLWKRVKNGEFGGFSIEGWFDRKRINVKSIIKMKKEKRTIWSLMGFSETPVNEPTESTFAEATNVDGMVLFYDAELLEGTQMMVELEGEKVPAPEGSYELTLEDEVIKLVTLDGNGVVTSVEDFEAVETDIEAQVADVMMKVLKDVNERFTKVEAENKALKSELDLIKKGEKFASKAKTGAQEVENKMSASALLKSKN